MQTSTSDREAVIMLFELYMEEGETADLDRALALIDCKHIKISEIMDAVQQFRADPGLKARAIAAIRKHFGLPLIPGPVCRR